MHNAIIQFRENLHRARELGVLSSAVTNITTAAVDVSDMWRAQIVLGVSALDHLIHEMSRLGMIESAAGTRPKTDSFRRFQLPLAAFDLGISGQPHSVWLGDSVREKHSWLSFQHPDKIAEAIRLISSIKLWDEVAQEIGMIAGDVKIQLEVIVDRRNKIAHEADMDPTNPGFRWPITEVMAKESLSFIEKIAEAVFSRVA